MLNHTSQRADIVIIGGGITGVGIARDASMRGFKAILIERGELGSGTSSYFHGELHSGARYAVGDPESAIECATENKILKKIIKDAIHDTGGLFLALSENDLEYADLLFAECKKIGIPIEEISVENALKKEPFVNPAIKRAFKVKDGFIDGTKAIALNKQAAENLGTQFLTHHQVVGFDKKDNRLDAVIVKDKNTNEETIIECNFVINAAGVWTSQIGKLADLDIPLVANKGSMIVLKNQLSNSVLNRCRPSGDGDILVPDGLHSIIGTTSIIVNDLETHITEQWEIDKLLKEGEHMVPGLSNQEHIRVYAGVRPLIKPISDSSDAREISRSFQILNHKKEGIDNFISIVGGKFTIHRLMAEKAVDEMCNNLKVNKVCQTTLAELSAMQQVKVE